MTPTLRLKVNSLVRGFWQVWEVWGLRFQFRDLGLSVFGTWLGFSGLWVSGLGLRV